MTELIWLNGKVMPLADATVSVEDRGFQFADGVYEVIRVYGGRPFTLAEHLLRLERSCNGIDISLPMDRAALEADVRHLVARSGLGDGIIYMQVTRGCAPRNHVFPKCAPTVLFYVRQLAAASPVEASGGQKLMGVCDERWHKCWIKSIALLGNVLAKNQAVAAGCDEAVMIHDGWVTECSASNIFIVSRNQLITPPVGPKVLPGITRDVLLSIVANAGLAAVERPFSEAELLRADEVFITSTTREINWVTTYNGRPTNPGRCGAATTRLHQAYRQRVRALLA